MDETISLKIDQDKLYRTRIILVSCYPLILLALRTSIEKQQDMEVIAETGSSMEAVSLAARLHPDIVIIDIDIDVYIPELLDGLKATRQIVEMCSGTRVLVLARSDDDSDKIRQAGASGYLLKRTPIELVFRALRDIAAGKSTFPVQTFQEAVKDAPSMAYPVYINKPDVLNSRELTILKMVANGKSNKDIALKLDISLANVKATLHNIFMKLNALSRTEAVSIGLKTSILTFNDLDN